jgi:hypothetical protein
LNSSRESQAQTASLNPVADAMVFSGEADFNYGGGGVFAVSAPGLPQGEFQALLRFDLAPARSQFDAAFGAGNWSLTSAVLDLTAASPNNPIFNASAPGQFTARWMQDDSWVEGTGAPTTPTTDGVTWNTLPSFLSASDQPLGTFAFNGATNGLTSYALTLSPGLVGDAADGELTSILLAAASGDTSISGAFNSRSFGTASRRPLLTLSASAVPEPATWMLAGCCLAVIAGLPIFRRRTHTGAK